MTENKYSRPRRCVSATWFAIFLFYTTSAAVAQTVREGARIGEVTVTGHRPLSEIALQKIEIDSVALRDNISLSMADVIGMGSSLFVKSSGRASLSTVSFRGTAPSHTAVTWNGIEINNPALGTTDFSLIPAYFVDRAALVSGASSVAAAGGALGGSVQLSSRATDYEGFELQYVQGIGSFTTFDEFLRFGYGNSRWQLTTRVSASSSKNDFPYTNHDRKNNIYDDNHNIIGSYYPRERNRNGSFRDIQLLQDIYFRGNSGNRFALNAWYADTRRNVPMLTTDYASPAAYINRQDEHMFRGVLSWNRSLSGLSYGMNASYVYSESGYVYSRDPGSGEMSRLIDSNTKLNTFDIKGHGRWTPVAGLMLNANIGLIHNNVVSRDEASLVTGPIRSEYSRSEISAVLSAHWQATERLGLSTTLRDDCYGGANAFIPAIFIEYNVYQPALLKIKASATRNYHFPSLNDLYYLPGGNPDLKPEKGVSYDAGAEFTANLSDKFTLSGSATWFQSFINDWIMWLPDTRGFFSPDNVKKVKSYGIEATADANLSPGRHWMLRLGASLSWTPSINNGEALSEADRSVGRQLPYIPRLSSSATANISWKSWTFTYKWCYYSRRYTMSSNENTLSGSLPRYFMNDISLGHTFATRPLDIALKLAVNNLLNADYQTILSRPMPGINFEFFVSLTPKFL